MEDSICHDPLVKGDQGLYSEPFASPSVLILGIRY